MPIDLDFGLFGPRYNAFNFNLLKFSTLAHSKVYKFYCRCRIRICESGAIKCSVELCYDHQNRFFFNNFTDEYPPKILKEEEFIYKAFQRHVTT